MNFIRLPLVFVVLNTLYSCYEHRTLKERITFQPFVEKGVRYDLKKWLEKSVPGPVAGECKPTWDFFYFRVNGFGIDSSYERRPAYRLCRTHSKEYLRYRRTLASRQRCWCLRFFLVCI
jgi:hypothetical protein